MRLLGYKAREDGATMVEFALVTVLLVMVLLSVVEMGRLILVYTTMADAARAGVRYAMVHGSDRPTGSAVDNASGPGNPCTAACAQVANVVKNYAGAGLVNTNNLQVTVSYPGLGSVKNGPGQPVTVGVSYVYNPLIGSFSSFLTPNLSSTSQGIISY
jgi:Flp pilus assembly protein TadG